MLETWLLAGEQAVINVALSRGRTRSVKAIKKPLEEIIDPNKSMEKSPRSEPRQNCRPVSALRRIPQSRPRLLARYPSTDNAICYYSTSYVYRNILPRAPRRARQYPLHRRH
jgi:hypothetical protein